MKIATALPKVNYHSHTVRCQHASGTEEEYVLQAIDLGLETLGFSDHTPWPYTNGYVSNMRMRVDELPGYLDTIKNLKEKYAGQINVRVGLECEYFPAYMNWLKELKEAQLDYVIMGSHFDTDDSKGIMYFGDCMTMPEMRRYVDAVTAGMETGIYNYVAHPELFGRHYPRLDENYRAASRDICQAARQLNIPLEYNLLGLKVKPQDRAGGGQGYPCEGFWEVAAETGCLSIIGFDAHHGILPGHIEGQKMAYEYLTGLGLEVIGDLEI